MSTETRPRIFKGIIDIFRELGNTETIESDLEVAVLEDPILNETLKNIENGKLKRDVETPANVTGGSKKSKGGFVSKMETNPEIGKAMREKRNQVVKDAQEKGIEL